MAESTESFDMALGRWWKFDRYEIRNGCICPAPGAELQEYDPWKNYHENATNRRKTEPIYQVIIELLKNVAYQPGEDGHPGLTSESETSITEWCTDYGLLGILPHMVQSIVLAPRWRPIIAPLELYGSEDDATSSDLLLPTYLRHSRHNMGWRSMNSQTMGNQESKGILGKPKLEGHVVSDDDRSADMARPHVLLRQMGNIDWKIEELSKTWGRFFPDVGRDEKETYFYPNPASLEFWKVYAEPLETFLIGANFLRNTAQHLGHMKSPDNAMKDDNREVERGIRALNVLVDPIGPAIYQHDNGSLRQRWNSPSLLASFAMMMLLDVSEQKRFLHCENCGKLFVSAAHQARYCSDTCRHTVQKRRYRANKKGKRDGKARA